MKNLYKFLFLLCVFYSNNSNAQYFIAAMNSLDSNFYKTRDSAIAYFDKYPALKAEEDGIYKDYQRWEEFYRTRVDYWNSNKNCPLKLPLQKLATYSQNPVCSKVSPDEALWTPLGPNTFATQNMGIVVSLYVNPANQNQIWAGSNSGGLFKTTNGGTTWTNITEDWDYPAMGISDIAVDPNNTNTIYISTNMMIRNLAGYGIGVLKTTDGGNIWTTTGLTFTASDIKPTWRLGMKPGSPNTIYALAQDGVYKTTNGGTTWPVIANDPNPVVAQFSDIEFRANVPTTVYFAGKEIWQYLEQSGTWTNLTAGLATDGGLIGRPNTRNDIEMSQDNNGNIYVQYATFQATPPHDEINVYVYRLNTSNNTWTQLSVNPSDPNDILQPTDFVVDPANPTVMYSARADGHYHFYSTTNSGTTWNTPAQDGMHADVRKLVFINGTGNAAGTTGDVYQGNDGGVGFSTNGVTTADSWTNINGTGLSCTQFFGIALSEINSNLLFGGAQDNGIFWNNAGTWSRRNNNADAYDCVISPLDPLRAMCFINGGDAGEIARTINGGAQWFEILPGGLLPSLNDAPIAVHPNGNAYVGKNDVYRTTDWGGNWTNISTSITTVPVCHRIAALDVAPSISSGNTIYIGYSEPIWGDNIAASDMTCALPASACGSPPCLNGKLFRTTNGGTSWTDITGGLQPVWGLPITDIIVHPENSSKLWVTFGGFHTSYRVMYSSDAGVNWTDVSTGLPEFPVNCITYVKGSNDALYVGTDVGVFYKDNSTNGWQCFQEGLPIGVVEDIEINYCTQKIKCSLYGRGVWESNLASTNVIQTIIPSGINTTWTGTTRLYGDLIIQANATVTMQGTTIVPKERKIVIERGGKLIVDGGTITNDCGCMWKGINVEGTYGVSQYTTGAQGWIEVKNSATISNARDAISTKRNNGGGVDYNYTGGIVQCTNSTFRNNRRSAEFLTFHNPSDINNRSYFESCTFEITAQLNDPATIPSAFISQWDVKGVQIRGNIFECEYTSGYTGTNRGKGVTSLDAVFNINETTGGGIGNTFTNLDVAVEQGTSAPVSIGVNNVTGNSFNDNRHGVYVSGSGIPPFVVDNTFTRPSPAVWSPSTFGFYSTGTKGITVGCNSFSNFTYGNLVLTTGTTSDPASLIIDNDFINNYRSLQTQNSNTNLQVSYNSFTAFASTQMHWYNLGAMANQGTCSSPYNPAGNLFLGNPPTTYKDIWSSAPANSFNYRHHSTPSADVIPVIHQNVTLTNCGGAWAAPTWCSEGGYGLMAGGGGGEEFSLMSGFNEMQGEPLTGEEIILDEINNYFTTEGLDTNATGAITYLEGLGNEQADWLLVPYYLSQENYTNAAQLLQSLEAENANEATRLNYYHTIADAGLEGRNLSALDSTEVSVLDIIAESSSDVKDNARSVLHFFYGRNYPIEEINVSQIPLVFSEPMLAEQLVIPNVITPNGDGSNDAFVIENLPEHSSLTIYSSNGTQVFHTDSYENNWPPSGVAAGRYYYTLNLPDGSEENSYFDVVY